jgi:excisionase family DNA binding protein
MSLTVPSAAFMDGAWGGVVDAAMYMGISVVTVHREIRAHRLPAFRVGGRKLIRLKKEHCDAYLQAAPVAVPYAVRRRRAS